MFLVPNKRFRPSNRASETRISGRIRWSKDELVIEKLSVSFTKSGPVLKEMSLKMRSAVCHCFMGPNGVGKTTLLNAIAGTLPSDEDQYQFPVSYMIQDYSRSILPWASVWNNLYLPHRATMTPSQYRAMLESFVQRYPAFKSVLDLREQGRELSGGQRQLVTLLRACCTEQAIILLDEPFSSLDSSTRRAVAHDLRRIAEEETRLIVASVHVVDDGLQIADYIHVAPQRPIQALTTVSINERLRPSGWLFADDANRARRAVCKLLE